jgi:hypothetical protein
MRCTCANRDAWRIVTYRGNHSAFSGYRFTPSDYSEVACHRRFGGCGARWRTKAKYVEEILRTQSRV